MSAITAVLSLLHQGPARPSSASRLFRREPVLSWTLRRLAGARLVTNRAILCWDDQLPEVKPIASDSQCFILSKAPRCRLPVLEAIAAARKWSEGWRGGLLGACWFDQGFHSAWINEIRKHLQSEAILVVGADAGLVDPVLIDGLISYAQQHPAIEYCFSPAAPGLSGVLIRGPLLERLAASGGYLGRALNYWPDLPGRDPISQEECAPVPAAVARTTHRFTLDSDRQVRRMEQMTISLNGQFMRTEAQALVSTADEYALADGLPRDVTLELNTHRATRPVYWSGRHLSIRRETLDLSEIGRLLNELATCDDIRLALGGVGDPLLAAGVLDVIAAANEAGIDSVHVETDLLGMDEAAIRRLVESPVDVVSVHIPATTGLTYQTIMGVDALGKVIGNVRLFLSHREDLKRGTPILAPTFTKCRENLHEMEGWYDYWLRAVGEAVMIGATDCAGQIPDAAVADMSPPRRRACRRLNTRVTILSDGRVVSCEQDVLGVQSLGHIGKQSIQEICQGSLASLRADHAAGQWDRHEACRRCREWDRP